MGFDERQDGLGVEVHAAHLVDTEFRGVAGTLMVNATLESKEADAAHIERIGTCQVDSLKKAEDGSTILVPQPSDDPNDTLNWSPRRKWLTLAVVAFCATIPDMQSAWGVPLVLPQAEFWHTTPQEIGRSLSGNIFMIGVGGVISVPLVQRFGRLPVLFWSMFVSFWITLWCTLATSPISFIVARCIQTTFSAAPEVIGLSIIYDMFFFHQRARAVGVWAWSFVQSPYIGPFISGIIANYKPWQHSFWACTGISGVACVAVILFVDETLYDRHGLIERPKEAQGAVNHRLQMLSGTYGARVKGLPTLASSSWRVLVVASRPYLSLILIYYAMTFMWAVGINATLNLFLFKPAEVGGYGFSELDAALLYFAPMIATLLGEIFGHFFNDYLANSYIKRHHGLYEPEVRLWVVWVASPFIMGGLIFLGFTLEHQLHWVAIAFSWGIYCFGVLIATVGVTAYALDIFQEEAAEASSLVNFSRTLAGFIVNYFQVEWAEKVGPAASFGTQGAICFVAFLLIVMVQWKGKEWRERFPPSQSRHVEG